MGLLCGAEVVKLFSGNKNCHGLTCLVSCSDHFIISKHGCSYFTLQLLKCIYFSVKTYDSTDKNCSCSIFCMILFSAENDWHQNGTELLVSITILIYNFLYVKVQFNIILIIILIHKKYNYIVVYEEE